MYIYLFDTLSENTNFTSKKPHPIESTSVHVNIPVGQRWSPWSGQSKQK